MNCDWRNDVRMECFARAEFVPPAMFGEAAWDCLLSLRSDEQHELRLNQLACLVSLSGLSLERCLVELERRELVTGELHGENQELRAVPTPRGRDLLETYLSATSNLQVRRRGWPRLAPRSGSGSAAN